MQELLTIIALILGGAAFLYLRRTTQIDHVVVSQFGIFVIETKNMKGWIFGGSDQARWTQVLHRHKSQFQNPLRQNYKHLKAVQELLGVELSQLHNVVAFVGAAEPKTAMPENVLWSERELTDYIRSRRNICISENKVRSCVNRLKNSSLESNRKTRRDHVRNVKAQITERQNNTTKCPRCSANMVERT
ncbi:MAG: nuclease-related domain-containing protein, partial [Maritimibacter sp.]